MADCTKCANRNNDYCIFACENGESFKPITNADRIRSMTDEELANEFAKIEGDPYNGATIGFWLDWLRKEVTDG